MNVSIDNLASEIIKEMESYSEVVTERVKKSVDIVAKEVNEEIKNHIIFKPHSGKYVKAFKIKKSYEDKFNKRNTWYVATGQSGLTHLLENGHALKGGGRTRSFPHIKFGEDLAKKRMEELAKEVIKDAGH